MSTVGGWFAFRVGDSAIIEKSGQRRTGWDFCELIIGYGLILAVIWTERPLQRWLYWAAIAWFALSVIVSFPGWKAIGCSIAQIWRAWWLVGAALVVAFAAGLLANQLHTLHHPSGVVAWVRAFAGYAVWATLQQFLLQGYFLIRLLRLIPNSAYAAITAASVFALAHLPNPILTPVTLLWGLVACFAFLKFRNIWPLAIAHAIFGISIAVTVPGPVVHNMRVGLGYLTYHPPGHLHRNHKDQRVSTVAWVIEAAPTRR
jgi:membrane protease YdiL (CAAX protease family)